jgi:putative ABC transport system permease protein
MIENYIKIAFRHLWQNKLYSSINTIGLAVGITSVLLAVLFIKDERSYDKFHQNNPNLYRITTTLRETKGDPLHTLGGTGQVQGAAFKAAIPEIKAYARVFGGEVWGNLIANDKVLKLQTLFVDPNFFDIFTFDLLRGDASSALSNIESVVITETTARKFFSSIDVLGKTMSMDADPSAGRLGKPLVISAVVKDPPTNSSIQFDILFPLKFLQLSFEDTNWLNAYMGTFLILHPGSDTSAVIKKFSQVYHTHAKEQLAENRKTYGYEPEISYGLQRITDIHLDPLYRSIRGNKEAGVINGSDPVYSYLFMGFALFILVMAAINFINISIASSLKRAKEVGVRKITGGSQMQIISQFLVESSFLCLIAFALALIVVQALLPLFNELAGKQIAFWRAFDLSLFAYLALILLAIVLMTGFYPAWILSRFRPTEVLYQRKKISGKNFLGRSLVVIQFSLAIFLMIATIIYFLQMDFVQNKDLGYNPGQVIYTFIQGNRKVEDVQKILKNEVAKEPSISLIAFGGDNDVLEVKLADRNVDAFHKVIDENYLAALEIPLIAGRNFSNQFPTDKSNSVIVNDAFVKAAGLTNPLGTQMRTNEYFDKEIKTIIGVVKDFHFGSLREPIKPMVMIISDWYSSGIWVKFEKRNQKQALAAFERIYKRIMPTAVYEFHFLDDLNAQHYKIEERWQKVITFSTGLSIFICCLGLFGLAHLSVTHRVKEIGIRKVLGASVTQITGLLSGDFVKLVFVAIVIASPLAWWVMNRWLTDFAYRIQINWWIFLLVGFLSILIAILTVGWHTLRAAVTNPIQSLRTE